MLKRRDFLTTCTVSTVALSTPLGFAAGNLPGSVTETRPVLSNETCQSLLQQSFHCVSDENAIVNLKLVEVREGPKAKGLEQFALVFEEAGGTGDKLPYDGLYTIHHPVTGPSLVHLAASDTDATRYTSYVSQFS